MVREDLIEGAITFLQDPSVSSAPVEQKIAFLRSKNLTQDEIDTSLARIGQSQQPPTSQTPPNYPQQQQQYRAPHQYPQQQPQQGFNNTGYHPQWTPPPPPLRRDWRDYFVVATLLTTLGYGLYWTANRYISPLISPPTPTQLQSDKDAVTESFDKAFALLDQLATDTTELKAAESARTERLDKALAEVEGVIREMREANEDRVREGRALAKEVEGVREAIPKALEREKGRWEGKLEEVGTEMRSLKTLIQGRMQAPGTTAGPVGGQLGQRGAYGGAAAGTTTNGVVGGTFSPAPAPGLSLHTVPKPETNDGGSGSGSAFTPTPSTPSLPTTTSTSNSTTPTLPTTNGDSAAAAVLPASSSNTSPYGRKLGGKAQIPSWQLAAKKRTEEAAAAAGKTGGSTSDAGTGTESGTATPVDGSAKVEAKPAEVSEEVVAEA
ncbi:peroxisomal membrane protein pex14 [Elasticomyces elasticus]|nr:peroxisomal membrane protein pex14 [Elasticomyces elasticus]KAK3649770.1 peroxisomal membrane protein pex14 [Elasticomyces elasticus]KAK4918105.1 peroxisomal membrane protein pex14 [Elasticomyces elasticus]KAK5757396.1 peroxisomal membrane protein pex14 [Elasticomyces elasticus]